MKKRGRSPPPDEEGGKEVGRSLPRRMCLCGRGEQCYDRMLSLQLHHPDWVGWVSLPKIPKERTRTDPVKREDRLRRRESLLRGLGRPAKNRAGVNGVAPDGRHYIARVHFPREVVALGETIREGKGWRLPSAVPGETIAILQRAGIIFRPRTRSPAAVPTTPSRTIPSVN